MNRSNLVPGNSVWDSFNLSLDLMVGDQEKVLDKVLLRVKTKLAGLPGGMRTGPDGATKPLLRYLLPEDYGPWDGMHTWMKGAAPRWNWLNVLDIMVPPLTFVVLLDLMAGLDRPSVPYRYRVLRGEETLAICSTWGNIAGQRVTQERRSLLVVSNFSPLVFEPGERVRVDVSLTQPQYTCRVFVGGLVAQFGEPTLLRPEWAAHEPAPVYATSEAPVSLPGRVGAPVSPLLGKIGVDSSVKEPMEIRTSGENGISVLIAGQQGVRPVTKAGAGE